MEWQKAFGDAAVSGVPLVAVVIGLVEWIRQMGVQGRALLVVSLLIGLALGGSYQLAQLGLPSGDFQAVFGGWLGVAVYGLGMGLTASGIVKVAKRLSDGEPLVMDVALESMAESEIGKAVDHLQAMDGKADNGH